jgi:phage repressor protein C with HTH and peptisase S24 domain
MRDLELSAQTLNRVVANWGGDPIPDDIWPLLYERRGLAEIPVVGAPAGEDVITLAFAEDVRAAAGSGEMIFEEAADHRIAVPRAILPTWVHPSGLICIRAAGDSMTPTLNDGDLILLDRKHTEPRNKQVFVIHTDDGLVVKRLREDDGGWEMASDNPAYLPRRVVEEDRIVGRVAWSGPLRAKEARAGCSR